MTENTTKCTRCGGSGVDPLAAAPAKEKAMTLQEQIDRMAKTLRVPKPTNVNPSQVFERIESLRAHRDHLAHETKKLRARLAAVEALIDKHPLGGSALIPATELRAALDI